VRVDQKLHSFFIDQDTALKNEEVATVGHLELISEIYALYGLYIRWARDSLSHSSSKGTTTAGDDLFHQQLSLTITQLCTRVRCFALRLNCYTNCECSWIRMTHGSRPRTGSSGSTRS
jgi:hypothetical protein